jgi:hypothetical protein
MSSTSPFLSTLKCYFALVFLFGACFSAWSQEDAKFIDDFFREDQFYLGASFMLLQSNREDFNPQGLSRHFQWGFIRDIPLSSSGKFATGIGLGMSFERFNTNLNRATTENNQIQYSIADKNNTPMFFSLHAVELPFTLRWRNATPDNFAFWRVYGGVSFRWNYYNKIRQNTFELKNSNDLENFSSIAHMSFGYNTWNFYLAYHLSPFFDQKSIDTNAFPLELNSLKIGLIFYIL